jgi:hypothetical protein
VSGIRREPLRIPAPWRAADLPDPGAWRHALSAAGDAFVQQGIPRKQGVVSDADALAPSSS